MVTINRSSPPSTYVVGSPAAKGFNSDCREFSSVTHVTHAFRAPEILRSATVSGRLVYDNSTLNTSRIHVVWVSPNHWGHGFRYGTVALSFDWQSLIFGRKAYWIEVAEYQVHACRLLLTDKAHAGLTVYDPTIKHGPWWHDTSTGKHYFNGDHCLEFMIEGDIPVSVIDETSFVQHHAAWCSEYRTSPGSCPDLGMISQEAGARFLARVAGSGESGTAFKPNAQHLAGGWGFLKMTLHSGGQGALKSTDPTAKPVATSALWHYGTKRDKEADALVALFASSQDAETALKECVESAFGLPRGTLK